MSDTPTDSSSSRTTIAEADHLRAVLDTVIDGIITINRRGVIQDVNPAAEQIFGYDAAEMIGRRVEMLMPAPYADGHQGYVDNYLNTGDAKIIGIGREVTGLRRDGSTFPMDLAVSEVDHLHVFVGVVRDLTERQRAEERLRQADRLASIGSLAAGLGHDMNNVLLPLRARLDALEAASLPEAAQRHVRAIRDSVSYLQQLTDGLHLLALDPRDAQASGGRTDLATWWDQVGPLLQRSLPRHVRLAVSMPTDLPPITVAPHRLTQVALNLLVNAGDAVGEDGRVRIEVERDAAGDRVSLRVVDNGSGMPADVRARAFEAFYSTKDRGRGTGLGLALVHGIVSAAGGEAMIDSAPGHGTTVTVLFPAVPDREEGGLSDDGDEGPPVVMISIEDDRIATMMATFFQQAGLQVRRGATGDPAEHRIWATSPSGTDVSAVQRFLQRSGRQVIACGPDARAWSRLGAIVVDDMFDFELVRDQVGEAVRRLDVERS